MEIIHARIEHSLQIIEVWQEFIRHHADVEPLWDDKSNTVNEFASQLEKQIKSDDALVLVAVEQERVAGFSIASTGNQPPVFKLQQWGTITDVGVKKEYRRTGIAERMLAEMFNWFAQKGITLIEVSVLARNQAAVSFWEKHGFQDFSRRMYRLMDQPDMH
jgi:ribosomal protein S18 acetylase RimI-like enzyme